MFVRLFAFAFGGLKKYCRYIYRASLSWNSCNEYICPVNSFIVCFFATSLYYKHGFIPLPLFKLVKIVYQTGPISTLKHNELSPQPFTPLPHHSKWEISSAGQNWSSCLDMSSPCPCNSAHLHQEIYHWSNAQPAWCFLILHVPVKLWHCFSSRIFYLSSNIFSSQ